MRFSVPFGRLLPLTVSHGSALADIRINSLNFYKLYRHDSKRLRCRCAVSSSMPPLVLSVQCHSPRVFLRFFVTETAQITPPPITASTPQPIRTQAQTGKPVWAAALSPDALNSGDSVASCSVRIPSSVLSQCRASFSALPNT